MIVAAVVYFFGLFSGGLEVDETCNIRHGERFDLEYRLAHPEHAGHALFPLSDRCNADYDMIPFWMNPLLVGLVVLAVWLVVGDPLRRMTAAAVRRIRTRQS